MMDSSKTFNPETALLNWRGSILNKFFVVAAAVSLPAIVSIIISAISSPELWPSAIAFIVVELILVFLAFLRKIPISIRIGILSFLGYIAAILNLMRTGLVGAAPLYLLIIPILILILAGKRAGMITTLLSGLIVIGSDVLIAEGFLVPSHSASGTQISPTTIIMLLVIVMSLLMLFYNFQERLVREERRILGELSQAQALLEDQNVTLEQTVNNRTKDLIDSNLSLEQRNAELALLNSVSEAMSRTLDIKSMTRFVGEKVQEIFKVDSTLIMLLDRQTNLIHVLYEYDENEGGYIDYVEPFSLGKGLSSKVITTGEPLMCCTLEEEIAEGAYFPPEIIEKGSGFFSQSWLGVPILAKDKVLGLIALSDGNPFVFNDNHINLLQTLSSTMGAALENARLFSETQQRAAELNAINTVNVALASELDVSALIQLVGEQIRTIFNSDIAYVALVDEKREMIHFPYTYGESITPIRVGEGLTTEVLLKKEPLLINQGLGQQILEIGVTLVGRRPLSYLGVPIIVNSEAVGVLSVQNTTKEGIFNNGDARLLSTIASSVSTALKNARLFEEIKLKEQDTRETRQRLANIINFLPDATLVIDHKGKVIAWNRTIEEMTGIPAIEMLGKGDYEYAIPFYGERRPILIDLVLMSQDEFESKYAYIHREGGILSGETFTPALQGGGRYLFATASVLHDADGNLRGAIEIIRDITERKKVENELRESNEKLRLIFESAFDGISIYEEIPDQEKRILLDCNDRYCEMAGRSRSELMSVDNTTIFQRSIVDPWNEVGSDAILDRESFSGIFSWIRPDGKENTIEYSAAPTKVGDRYFTIGLDRDITERIRVENELRESNEKLRLIFETAFDGISVYEEYPDEDRRTLLDCNERYCQMAGRSKEELLQISDTRSIQLNIDNPSEQNFQISVKEGEAYSGIFSWLRPDGKENIIEYNAAPSQVGDRYYTIGLDREITERMRVQQELRKAKAEADQANYAKSAFLANMSHELRTPLNAIIGFTRIVRRKGEGALPEKQIENLDKVLTSADNLLNLINTVLDIAKIEAGRMDVLPANFRVRPLIDLCVNTAQPMLRPRVKLEKEVDESVSTIYSDQDKIRQIILNLLSNAVKFTHRGEIILSVKQDDEYMYISVADTGIGISSEALPKIFTEFEQADTTTTRKYGGTGLGLTISRNLARLLGGDLSVQSEFGKGSTFTLTLPKNYERDLSVIEPSRPVDSGIQPPGIIEAAPSPKIDSTKINILIIDDDPDSVYLLKENLDQKEFEVISCRNGLEGLKTAREIQPQVILLDILMPGMDGWQVLNKLKNDPKTSNIPVILHSVVDRKPLGFQLGASAYLMKPLDPVAVQDALSRVIVSKRHQPILVLVVDDDPNVVDMLSQFLPGSEFVLQSAVDGLAGLESIKNTHPDILLLDLMMPRLDGFGVIEELLKDPEMEDLPIIVITAKELSTEETSRLNKQVSFVMKKQGFQGEQLVEEIKMVLRRKQ